MCKHCTSLPQGTEEALELVRYERDKGDLPGPSIFWKAIWPEGGKPEHGRVNSSLCCTSLHPAGRLRYANFSDGQR